VVSVSTLEDDGEGAGLDERALGAAESDFDERPSAEAPWRRELERSREERRRSGEPSSFWAAPGGDPGVGQTVPVPPRAEGGWVGNLLQSVVVGGEIMGALVTGPVLVALRSTAAVFDRVLTGVPGILGSLLRLVMMLLVMAALGALVALAGLAAFAWNP
jgi:hypothetical protein